METTFGEYLKRLRLARGLTLRGFCEAAGVDPANYSKWERGVLPPPADPDRLACFLSVLELAPDSEESRELERLAALDRGEIPRRVLSDPELLGKLPALFRTLEGDPVNEEQLDALIEMIRRE